jgi:DNA-binding response OmpR family regulator
MAGLGDRISGLRILVIDDEPQVSRALERNLTRAGAQTTVAASLSEGLRQLEQNGDWDILLIDQMLPDGDGLDVLDGIDRLTNKPAVIAISANLQCSKRSLRLQSCGAVLLPKPFDREDLWLALAGALSSRDRAFEPGRAWPARATSDAKSSSPKHLCHESILLDLVTHIASVDGSPVELQPAQVRILAHLLAHPGRRFSAAELAKKALRGNHDSAGGNIRFQIHALRRRLGEAGRLIETLEHGYGIGFATDAQRSSSMLRGPRSTLPHGDSARLQVPIAQDTLAVSKS